MDFTREEVAERNGGNRFFAAVAEELRQDFCQEGQHFYGQGVEAEWDTIWNGCLGMEETVLNVRDAGAVVYEGGVSILPCRRGEGGAFGVTILASNGGGSFFSDIYEDRVSEFKALELCRLACVARFGVMPRRREDDRV